MSSKRGINGSVKQIHGEELRVAIDNRDATGPAILFSNGLGTILDYWDPVVDRLPDLTSIRFDRPGLGGSPVSKRSSRDLGAEIDRLLAVGSSVDPQRKLILVGHSYGGVIVEAAARLHPERVAGLVLVDSSDPAEHADPKPRSRPLYARAIITFAGSAPQVAKRLGAAIEQLTIFVTTARKDGPRLSAAQRALVSTPGHLASIFHEDARMPKHCSQLIDIEQRQPMPDIPVHMLVGGESGGLIQIRQKNWIKRAEARLPLFGPRSRIEIFRAAHLMMFDVPAEIAEAITMAAHGIPRTASQPGK